VSDHIAKIRDFCLGIKVFEGTLKAPWPLPGIFGDIKIWIWSHQIYASAMGN